MAALETWIDYSSGTVSGAAMEAYRITGAFRYVGIGGAGKRLTRAEYADHCAHGRQTVAVVERLTTDADGGAGAGRANAQAALTDLARITAGLPPITRVLMANDKPTYVADDVHYLLAAGDEFAGAGIECGPYGFGSFLLACHRAGCAPISWQAGPAPSRTGTSSIAMWWQRNGGSAAPGDGPSGPVTIALNGVVCDLSNRLLAGPTPVPEPIPLNSRGGTMLIVGSVNKFNTQAIADGGLITNLDPVTAEADPTTFPRLAVSDGVWNKMEQRTIAFDALPGQVADLSAQMSVVVSTLQAMQTGLPAAISAEQVALLAAIQAEGTAQVSQDALEAALAAANVPAGIISALANAFAAAGKVTAA